MRLETKTPYDYENECLGPYLHQSMYHHEHNCHASRVDDGFGADIISALNEPVKTNA